MSSDNTIKRYLLGMLDAEERQRVEEHLISDRDFFEQVMIVEDELLDDYVDGSLPEVERERFLHHFLSAPQQHQSLRLASILRQYVSGLDSVELPKAGKYIQRSDSWLSRLLIAIRTRTISTVDEYKPPDHSVGITLP